MLWTFGPNVVVDLHPAGAVSSQANDVEGNVQVGTRDGHAAMWFGTAASVVDLNPAGAASSFLNGIDGAYEVGGATIGASMNAGLWTGTASSFLNLHTFLTPGVYSSSEAHSVWTDGSTTKVVGSAFNSVLGRNEAILWTATVPEPSSLSLLGVIGIAAICRYRRRINVR
jgi:hypothetical protein